MKKTVIVNINGIIFHIDEDAYVKISAYLDALHRYFDQQTEGKEIVSDIESRIAELLQPLINETKQSVTIDDIETIIATLGKPEDIAGEESPADEPKEQKPEPATSRRYSRRLYRDPDNSILGGVCAGIANYFDIDPVLIRIVFIALVFAGGVSFIIYPILWIAIPVAKTAAQKLEMRGESVTINNIERTYHSSEQIDPDSFWGRVRGFLNDIFSLLGRCFFVLWRIVSFLIGVFLIFVSVVVIISLIAATFFNKFYINEIASTSNISVKEFLNFIVTPAESTWLLIVLLFVIFIPLIGLIYAGLKLVIRFKVKDKWAVLSMFLLWIAAIIVGTVLVFSHVNNYKIQGTAKETVTLSVPKSNILYLSSPYSVENELVAKFHIPPHGLFGIRSKNNKNEIWGMTRIDIEKSSKSYPELEVIREARGITIDEATNAAKQIKASYGQKDSTVTIDPTFWITQNKWKFQKVRVILHLPVGIKVYLDPNTMNCLDDVENTDDYWDRKMVDKMWQMTESGLEQLRDSKVEMIELKSQTNHSLYIQQRDRFSVAEWQINSDDFGHIANDGKTFNFRAIHFDMKKSEDNSVRLQVEKKISRLGNSDNQSIDKVITYSFEQKDTILWLDPIFLFPQDVKQNDQEVNLTVYLPIDFRVSFGNDMEPLMRKYAEKHNISEDELVNKRWKMTFDGLKEIEEKKDAND